MRRALVAIALIAVAAAAAYQLLLREETVEPRLQLPRAVATIGSGASAVGVSAEGGVLRWLPPPEDESLPQLPLTTAPDKPRLSGPLLEQARVLGAAPAALRPHLEGSLYGESGVDVMLRSGIELRFGDASRLAAKWRAATAVLADPGITELDYVDLHAPSHPAVEGSEHLLPSLP